MHYCAYVMLPPGTEDVEETVAKLMEPYNEERQVTWIVDGDESYWTNPQGFWDWWQLGGRWTGRLSDYDPHFDPRNLEPCDHYGHALPCSYCEGTGLRLKWPTDWVAVDSDLIEAKVLADLIEADPSKLPYTFLAGERVMHREIRNPEWSRDIKDAEGFTDYSTYLVKVPDYSEQVLDALRRAPAGCLVVVVDYHN